MEIFHLSSEDIMAAAERTFDFLTANKADRKEALRLKLAAEEVLLTYRQEFGEAAKLELYAEKRMKVPCVIFRIAGSSYDPFGKLNEDDWLMHNLMVNMGTAPVWNYRRGCNEVVLTAGKKEKMSSVTKILLAVVLGIGLGMLTRLLPGSFAHDISEDWLAPVQNAIMGFLSCLSALFMLLSVTTGVCSMGDVSTFNRIGRGLILRIMLVVAIDSVFAAIVTPLFFKLSDSGTGSTNFAALWQMLVDIIPTNIVETFSTGNTMQIVFLAIFASMILLVMGHKAHPLVEIIAQLSDLLKELIQYVIMLMPVVVFISLFRLNADGDISQLLSAYKYPLIVLMFCTVYLIAHIAVISLRHHISPLMLIKKLLPSFLIALTTSSSTAALSETLNTCENKLGIDKQIINVGIPLGQTLYMPSVVFEVLVGILCTAQIFDVPISPASYLILIVTAYILSIADPPLPGASVAMFTLVMAQMGIPSDALVIIIALDAIVDRILTSTNVAGLQMTLIGVADSLGMLDGQTLGSDK